MGRLINPESAGKERTRLTKAVVLSIRELAKQTEPGPTARDMAAFIALALLAISDTIDVTVLAWEKRDYWVKADRFRMDWAWAEMLGKKMSKAVIDDDWAQVASLSAQIAGKLSKIQVGERHRLGTPWVGAWEQMQKTPQS